MINNNPDNLKKGDIVIVDGYKDNEYKIVDISKPTGAFATIQSITHPEGPCSKKDVMTTRLTRK